MKRYFTFHRILAIIGLLLWFGETAYFGFNAKPESGIERMFDITSQVLLWWGIIGDITHNVTITKATNITTEKTFIQKADLRN